ncbi:peptidoglycan-binding protein [Terriglobus sp. RCC_193]|uniref:peptidoglycan-binding protein n=1 Tax=Terriglobus sp. RCC_193 TaxID=3239218 RepID=UPI003525916F
MRFYMASAATLLLFSSILPLQASRVKRGPTAKHKKTQTAAPHQRAIDNSRATQIQTALVKAGYLKEASGHWDSESQAAMQKLQGDNGWQTKLVPDSRALIKLGLGPNSQATPTSVPVALSKGGSAAAQTDVDTFGGK